MLSNGGEGALVWKRNQIISYFFHRRHTAAHYSAQYEISEHVQYTEAGQKRLKGPFTLRFYKRWEPPETADIPRRLRRNRTYWPQPNFMPQPSARQRQPSTDTNISTTAAWTAQSEGVYDRFVSDRCRKSTAVHSWKEPSWWNAQGWVWRRWCRTRSHRSQK